MINPFPGLRPFGADEAHLFFGREEHVDELLEKLRSNRFVAVVGSSGSGKSSLVLAGLFPALDGGALGAEWRIASLRPGRHPIANLARALRDPAVSGSPVPDDPRHALLELGFSEAALRRSYLGLIEAVREIALKPGESLLLLVDQFEEIFRYQGQARDSTEADAFVPLLLEAVRQSEVPIHVILTLRSDFLGQCVRFPGLPEAINSGQYLIPRLNRRQRLAAIAGPARVAGAEISPPLLQRLLNDVGDNPDQLPILQHALMRTFDLWKARGGPAEGAPEPSGPLEVTDYEAAGTLAKALSNHAEEVFAELTDRQREIAEALFRSLTEATPEGQHIRRPAPLGEIAEIAGASVEEVLEVVEPFRAPGRTFLVLPQGVPVTPETRVDISHESLMRLWDRLREWSTEEAKAARSYRRMANDAQLHAAGELGLWRDPELELALRWRERHRPNAAWARRYGLPFEPVLEFLELSRAERDHEIAEKEQARQRELDQAMALAEAEQRRALAEKRSARRLRRAMAVVVVALLAALASMAVTLVESRKLRESQVRELAESANHLVEGHSNFEGLLAAYDAGLLWRSLDRRPTQNPEVRLTVSNALVHALFGIHGKNHWTAHRDWPTSLVMGRGQGQPGGGVLISAGHERVIRTWSLAGKLLAELRGHEAPILALAASPVDGRFVSGDDDGVLIFWSPEGRQIARRRAHGGRAVQGLHFHPDGRLVASSGEDGTLQLWRSDGTALPAALAPPSPGCQVRSLRFHPRRALLAAGCSDGKVHIYEQGAAAAGGGWTERIRLMPPPGPASPVLTLDFDPEQDRLAAGNLRGKIHLWPLGGGPPQVLGTSALSTVGATDGPVHAVLFSPRHKALLSAGADRLIHVWDEDGQEKVLRGHTEPVVALALSPDGQTLASTSRDMNLWTWQIDNPYRVSFSGHQGTVWEVDIHPAGTLIASAGDDGTVKLWTPEGAAVHQQLAGFGDLARTVRFSPDGRWLAAGSHDGQVRVWQVEGADPDLLQLRERALFQADTEGVNEVSFSPDSRLLLTAGLGGTVRAWQPGSGQAASQAGLPVGPDPRSPIWGARMGPRGEILWVGADGLVRLRGAEGLATTSTGRDGISRGAFSPGGEIFATAGRQATLWSRTGHRLAEQLTGPAPALGITNLAFSPDGRRLAVAGREGEIQLWDLENKVLRRSLLGHDASATAVVFGPKGDFLVSGSSDETVRVWHGLDLTFDELMERSAAWLREYRELHPASLKEKLDAD